jgi:hypothetical protein
MLLEWDPLGVSGAPQAADEYDCMISPLLHKLFEGSSEKSLAAWIDTERTNHFGLGRDLASDQALANRLSCWWAARTAD